MSSLPLPREMASVSTAQQTAESMPAHSLRRGRHAERPEPKTPELPAGVLMRSDVRNQPRNQPGERLHQLFEQRCDALVAQGRGAHLAVHSRAHQLSYPQLDALANQLARLLLAQGAGPGSVLGLLFDKTAWSYAAMLAVGKIHAAYVPVDPGFPADRIAFIAQDAGVRWMLSTGTHQALAASAGVPVLCLDALADTIGAQPTHRLTASECPGPVDELCYTIYTSGSTGRPKGVPIDHPSIVNFVRVAAEEYGYRDDDRVYQGLTLAFDFAVEEIWVPLTVGATLLPNPSGGSLLGQDLADFLRSERVTALCCVPTLLATLDEALPDLRLMIVSGEACPRDLVQRWHRPGRLFLNAYGPTEATVTATLGRPLPGRPVSIGQPLPTYAIVILPPDACRALPFGEEGEIGIAGIGIARGYLNRDDQTKRAFIADEIGIPHNSSGRIYRSGDLGRINAQGEVEYLGRIDTQVKIRGYRIELAEIESLLLQCPGVAQAVVNPWPSSPGVLELVAYYTVPTQATPPQPDVLAAKLREHLPPYMVPAYFECLPSMPMLASDKADRKALPPPSQHRLQASQRPFEAPAPGLESDLAHHLAQLLGLPQVSAADHFFSDLGMNSLLLARYSAQLRRALGPDGLSMRLMYGQPTVRGLAAELARLRPGGGAPDHGACADASANTQVGRAADTLDKSPASWPVHQATRSAYLACGAAQLALASALIGLHGAAWWEGMHWVLEAATWGAAVLRSMVFAVLYSLGFSLLPVLAKWLLVGRWQAERFPVWGWRYLRFWALKALIRSAPVVVTAGTPLYTLYLRALGARIDATALVALRQTPVCTDLLTVGPDAVLGHHTQLSGYRVLRGWVETGPVQVGARAQVGEFSLLDIHSALGDGAELAHSSSLQAGQRVPAGARWHGSPAQPAPGERRGAGTASFNAPPLAPVSGWARTRYTLVQLALGWGLVLPLPAWLAFALWGEDGQALDDTGTAMAGLAHSAAQMAEGPANASGLVVWLAVAGLAYVGVLLLGLLWVATVPRWLGRLIEPGRNYPLYGWHYWLFRLVRSSSNVPMFNALFGDSGDIVHYQRAIGWRLPGLKQTGSNFGMAQQHDLPERCTVGSGTMVSDGLSMLNATFDARSFCVHDLALGAQSFVGNLVAVVPGHRVGNNCLLASKVMVPVDGPLREGVGLLGSPAIEIPRATSQDDDPVAGQGAAWLQDRLRRKQRANRRVMLGYLAANAVPVLVLSAVWHVLYPLGQAHAGWFAAAFALLGLALSLGWMVLVDAASRGFAPLQPHKCSIYEPEFWRHERHWKLGLANDNPLLAMLAGTPLRGWAWRALGVQVGRQLFDDGGSITEKTLVRLGAHCTLGANCLLQGHSLEDGLFKSDRLWLGDGITVGSQAYLHYATRLEDRALVLHDAFVMKGEQLQAGELWVGNPAQCVAQAGAPPTRATTVDQSAGLSGA